MEKTLFSQISEYIADLKKFKKRSVKVEELSERFDSFVKDKFTVDLQISTEPVKIEGLTKTQSDTISTIFESFLREFEANKAKKEPSKSSNNGFELVAEWTEDDKKKKKGKKQSKTESLRATPPLRIT